MNKFFESFLEKIKPVTEKIKPVTNKLKPIKDAIINRKTAMIFNITYSVLWNLILIFIIVLVLVVALGAGVGAGYFASLVKDEEPRSYDDMRKDIYNYEEPSEVYFADEVYLGRLRSDIIREEVQIENVSEYVLDAIISTEDQTFETHEGVVPKAVLRALFQEVTNASISSGGSTLTQQLVKNQILTSEVSFERKAKEILLALRLENFFEKDEILEAYLNVSSFGRNSSGQNIAGVQAAAKGIFGVDAKDLTLPQAAFIAGLPQSPNGYTPFTREGTLKSEEGLAPGLNRQKTVLSRMLETGAITEQQYNEAVNYDLVADFIGPQNTTLDSYPALTMEAERRTIEILMKMYYEKDGYTKDDIEKSTILKDRYMSLATKDLRQNGYQIYTTIDKEIYDAFNEVIANFKNYAPTLTEIIEDEETGEQIPKKQPIEVGVTLLENGTGRIISFVGGRDYSRNQQNHATQGGRPNGSTMKPLLVYAPAIEEGILAPGSIIPDIETVFPPNYSPNNFERRYMGLTTAREAVTYSYNVTATRVLQKNIGNEPFNYLEKMGMETLNGQDYKYIPAALGPANVTVEENTNAYATLANGGNFVEGYMIEKIVDKDGNVIYQHEVEPVEVFSPQTAYLTLDMMRDVMSKGTGRPVYNTLNFSMDLAGKTGTSNESRDFSFVGLNPNITMGIWMGYDHNEPVSRTYATAHLQLWAQLMNAAHALDPELIDKNESFKMPGGIVEREFCTVSGMLPSDACKEAGLVSRDYFTTETAPTKTDNSLIKSKYVTIGGKNYLATDATPNDFAQSGFILNPEFIKTIAPDLKEGEYKQLIPDKNKSRWKDIVIPDSVIQENGKKPDAIKISHSNSTISWSAHGENDVVGYYVYSVLGGIKTGKVAAIKSDSNLSFTLPSFGQYAVTAVDIAGNESELSNIITNGFINPPGNEDGEDNGEGEDEDEEDEGGIIIIPPIEPPGEGIEPPRPPKDER